jgi:hypothetical protein
MLSIIDRVTSILLSAKIEPNKYAVTSVFKPQVTDVTKIPIANALVEINAIAASPFIPESEELIRNRKNAAINETGSETINGVTFNVIAIAIAPKPTWLSPSPIME